METNSSDLDELIDSLQLQGLNKSELFSRACSIYKAYSYQAILSESLYNKAIVSNIEDGNSVSEATTRAKAEMAYQLKQEYEAYAEASKLILGYIQDLTPHLK